jgi:hypothetical protein
VVDDPLDSGEMSSEKNWQVKNRDKRGKLDEKRRLDSNSRKRE